MDMDLAECATEHLHEHLHEPLRREVAALRVREQRRRFPARLVVGRPAGPRVGVPLEWPPPAGTDDGLLGDLVEALLDRADHEGDVGADRLLWLERAGPAEPHDSDLRLAAVTHRVLAGRTGPRPVGLVVVTRYGWLAPRTGEARRWKRLRIR